MTVYVDSARMSELGRLWPTCAVCRGPVKRFVIEKDLVKWGVHFFVYCHGTRNELFLQQHEWDEFARDLRAGEAFGTSLRPDLVLVNGEDQ